MTTDPREDGYWNWETRVDHKGCRRMVVYAIQSNLPDNRRTLFATSPIQTHADGGGWMDSDGWIDTKDRKIIENAVIEIVNEHNHRWREVLRVIGEIHEEHSGG